MLVAQCDTDLSTHACRRARRPRRPDARAKRGALARLITGAGERRVATSSVRCQAAATSKVPVLGITGTGGAGKSSLTDELVRRLRLDQGDALKIAVVSIDPSRKRTGGALLGDRIRMNAIVASEHLHALAGHARRRLRDLRRAAGSDRRLQARGLRPGHRRDLGIGQGDAAIVPFVDCSLYVMTPEFGAASQLEKIDMLDFADFVAINKFDRKGAEDALRDVRKQVQRNRETVQRRPTRCRCSARMAARFNDDGVTALYQALLPKLASWA
jgi:methylmalonyl-CoA mutase